ncbi:replication initiation and membrane attachment family protein [Vagococcus xieshaowenii]|uniref:Uncharacterized protein n=1 Tax=Vagococcus xieshaowenii TaxID=2562451 RepID=A0A4Z0DDL5_9ENTE|nr:DnaD domain protein [Vagococcus xieshaowenii]QCA28386.1 hypothetical protein E4Z98_03320 [Vagococcus xieshaowenii]TFZ42858.1 hypothetical protein E4031_02420 [Vagococcus xieshaowenii]
MGNKGRELKAKDTFFVQLTELVSDVDLNVLNTLYRPLLGTKAFGLYHAFYMMTPHYPFESLETFHSDLFSECDLGLLDFVEARKKLEALGLLRVFVQTENETQTFLYRVEKPMSYHAFLKDDMLSLMLLDRVGQRRFERLMQEIPQRASLPDGYHEVTTKFVDVYQPSRLGVSAKPKEVATVQEEMSISKRPTFIQPETFDWSYFEQLMARYNLVPHHLLTIKNELLAIHQQYGFDELTLRNYLANFVDYTTNEIEMKKFKYALVNRSTQQVEPATQVGEVVSSNKPVIQEDTKALQSLNEQERHLVISSNEYAPMEFLEAIKSDKKGSVVITERWAIEKLVKQSGLSNSVINILIHYLLSVQNKATFEEITAFKIANDWSQSGVKTPADAINRTKKTYHDKQNKTKNVQYNNKTYNNKPVRKETLPDWVNQETKETKMSAEKQALMREKLRQMRQKGKDGEK